MNRVVHNIYPVILFFLSLILVLFTDPEILRERAPSYVVFTCFHRMPGKGWHPKGRMNFIKRLLIASMSGLAGLSIQGIIQEIL